MARNEEKHFGRLNRVLLQKEKEEYEKKHPKRPRLDSLDTVEEIKEWLPSIKRDLNFYLNKSQVVCYSDDHIEECKLKILQLEKEYKAFVRKIAQLNPGKLDAVPWTSRAYKLKNQNPVNVTSKKEFKPIYTPILNNEEQSTENMNYPVNLPFMDEPLSFKPLEENSRDYSDSQKSVNSSIGHLSKNCFTEETVRGDISISVSSVVDGGVRNLQSATLVNYSESDSDS